MVQITNKSLKLTQHPAGLFNLSMGVDGPHNNQYLFSDHYLDHLLRDDPRWAAALPEAEAFLAWLRELYNQEKEHLPHYSEAQLEEHWIKPILTRLGHVYEAQPTIPGLSSNIRRPDYVFFPDEAERQAAVTAQNSADYAAHALAVGDAKKWAIPLGKKQKGGSDSFEYQNPSYQIDTYLRSADLTWGILTNGQKWRLVHRESSYRLATYYEIDLLALLARAEADPLRYFTLFFRQAAFRADGQGRHFLVDALAASRAYAVALEEDLRENVYRALEKLLQGFLDLPANQLTAADLPAIYQNSLILLYRLIFILYGESRGLLPMQNAKYREQYSLASIKKQFAELQQQERLPAPMTSIHWGYIKQLFQIINGDDANLNQYLGVPRYNGGLFDPGQHPFLAEKAVGDRALVEAINLLSLRRTEAGPLEFVDYRTLGVRQLGSVYEGLLEYQPRAATGPLVAIRDGKNKAGRWVAKNKAPKKATILEARAAGQVYLETDRGERKATGSYYTPQYIVEYIVDNTLGPLVEAARQRVKGRANEAPSRAAAVEAEQSFIEEILSLTVLDPAMGSGHFLVEATEYLARALATDPYVTADDSPTEEDLTIWKRRVVERCIYGVDKNPLAVELAKLSLWLSTVAAEKPLSFLDHHLKCGDALVGARVADVGEAPPLLLSKKQRQQRENLAAQGARQANLFEQRLSGQLPVMLGKVLEITRTESDSYETVHAKEAADRAVAELKAPFEAAANLWVSAWFGHSFKQGDYDATLDKLHAPAELLALPAVQQAQAIAAERRFFHWELAFPEVFYDENGQPLGQRAGFDAVVGNPPYGFTEKIVWFEKFQNDLFVYFWKQSVDLCKNGGELSLITPTAWLTGVNYQSLRKFILDNTQIEKVIGLPYDIFGDAYIDTCIAVLKIGNKTGNEVLVRQMGKRDDGTKISQLILHKISSDIWQDSPYQKFILDPNVANLQRFRADPNFIKFGEIIRVERGVQPYSRSKHSEDQIEKDFLRLRTKSSKSLEGVYFPELLGEELSRYVILPKKQIWLQYSDELASKRDIEFFTQPRVVLRRLLSRRRELMAAFTAEKLITTDNILNILLTVESFKECYVLALINSTLIAWLYTNTSAISVKDDFPQVTYEELKSLPIRRIEFTTPAEERARLAAEGEALYRAAIEEDLTGFQNLSGLNPSALFSSLLAFTLARLDMEPEQSDVIHDLLAYLAGQMIDLNQQKQRITEDFWLDLEGVADGDTFPKLRDKGKWEATLWKEKACRPYVNEESRSTRSLDESLGWDEAAFKAFVKALAGSVSGLSGLVGGYRQHGPAYRRLVQSIAATDWLIDRIVYQLYGLTAEEIAIVENKT